MYHRGTWDTQAGSFDSVNFCEPPRGILTLDEDVVISKNTPPDGDFTGTSSLVIQGGGQRWKLSSEAPGEINRWEEVGTQRVLTRYRLDRSMRRYKFLSFSPHAVGVVMRLCP